MKITSSEIRQKYLDFFASKHHAIIPSSPLVPENDPSVLFNTAGMQPLVPYLLGETHPLGKRLVNSQKCVRTGDIDDVGDDTHLTFFEMLGNWSLGDYFKSESIAMSWEFLTSPDWLGLDPEMISVTVFEGNTDCPPDDDSIVIWKQVWKENGLDFGDERIARLPAEDNWWAAGPTGPCGPDTEIFYWMGEGKPPRGSNKGTDSGMWMEIWNNVFMQYNRVDEKTLINLPAQCVDTGMGLERVTVTLNHMNSVYDTDCFAPVLLKIKQIIEGINPPSPSVDTFFVKGGYNERSARIIADHLRAATHMIADGVVPKNVDQGYILRRLIRRAIREAYKMGYEGSFCAEIASLYIEQFYDIYESIRNNAEKIKNELTLEEGKFSKTLKDGVREFEKILKVLLDKGGAEERSGGFEIPPNPLYQGGEIQISGSKAFTLFDTYGFPLEMTLELARENNLTVDIEGFNQAFERHQELSRTASAGKFKGGLADDGETTTALHTGCHLMLAGLRKVLGNHVHQAGSNITSERLRFDFTHGDRVSPEQIIEIEKYVNEAIQAHTIITLTTMGKEEARSSGVEGSFWEKYPDIVKVYTMTGSNGTLYSQELCGGPHLETTDTMGVFKIIKEESSGSGVRRIKAILEK